MKQHIHILGIAGTFMSGIAQLARALGHHVTGSDLHCYDPIQTLLRKHKIAWTENYDLSTDIEKADLILVGNVMKRGLPIVEWILNTRKAYTSGPEWLAQQVLHRYRVIAVAGTHGKTTTTAMLTHILECAGYAPGFLIGGVAPDFDTNARLGDGDWFVIEADEYDSAFFDKRPKFMHYRPEIAILNNLEFDHADIYPDLAAIQTQFHYLLRTVPEHGAIIRPRDDNALDAAIARGCYTPCYTTALQGDADFTIRSMQPDGSQFTVYEHATRTTASVSWRVRGTLNIENALSAIAAAKMAGVPLPDSTEALQTFQPVKRRLEITYQSHGITVLDDFAHHPTAMQKTLKALRDSRQYARILLVMEFASNTMRSGIHAAQLLAVMRLTDYAFIMQPEEFDCATLAKQWSCETIIRNDVSCLVEALIQHAQPGDAIVIMSNRGFGHIQERIVQSLPK